MRIFISWSGSRSLAVAKLLREFVPQIIQMAEVVTSTDDIPSGSRWFTAIHESITSADLAVLCVTRENLNSPWFLFEAGALSTSHEPARIVPYLFDISPVDISGPLAAFQAVKADRDGTMRLLQAANGTLSTPLAETTLLKAFQAFWPDLERQLSDLRLQEPVEVVARGGPSAPRPQPMHEQLDEVLQLVRALAKAQGKSGKSDA
jgi:TIR domain